MYNALVFDFDDTIVDSNRIKRLTFLNILKKYKINENEVHKLINDESKSRVEVFKYFLDGSSDLDLQLAIEAFSKQVFDGISKLKPSAEFFKVINYAKMNNILLVLSSNTPELELTKILTQIKIKSNFDEIHGYPKRKEETLKKIIEKYHFEPKSILVIGDGESDRYAAKKNNTDFYHVNNVNLSPLISLLDV